MQEAFSLVPIYQICIDKAGGRSIAGRLYHGMKRQGEDFTDIQQLILSMDRTMDRISFPQSTVEKRTFDKQRNPRFAAQQKDLLEMRRFMADKKPGDKATFVVQVEYRHDAEWQGNVKWVEGEETADFASTLELIKFLDKVSSEQPNNNGAASNVTNIERKKM